MRDYEEDHLIPLSLGGACRPAQFVAGAAASCRWTKAEQKDQLEDTLHRMVCKGSLSLYVAQRAIAGLDSRLRSVCRKCSRLAGMCGRFASQLPPELLRRAFVALDDIPNTPPSWNVGLTQAALVVRRHPKTGERRLDALRWGLMPHFTKDLKVCKRPINARSETIASSGMFRGALAVRRCLMPAMRSKNGRLFRTGSSPMPSRAWTARSLPLPACGKVGATRQARRCARSRSPLRQQTRHGAAS